MREFKPEKDNLVNLVSGSDGCQLKYKVGNYWLKQNRKGYEGLSEYYTSLILSCTTIKDYVSYELCKINDRKGCFSEHFLSKGETLWSFERVYKVWTGKDLLNDLMSLPTAKERIDFVLDFFNRSVKCDIKEYLKDTLALDYLTLNTDRHLKNLTVIERNGQFRPAPIFDNGDAFCSDYNKFPLDWSLEECIEKCYAQPFSGNHYTQANILGMDLGLDKKKAIFLLEKEPDSRCKKFALARLRDYDENKTIEVI